MKRMSFAYMLTYVSCWQPSALGVQRGLKDSVVNDMCRAVVKHMVGDVYVSSTGQQGTKKVLNHLYEPVLQSVQVRVSPRWASIVWTLSLSSY